MFIEKRPMAYTTGRLTNMSFLETGLHRRQLRRADAKRAALSYSHNWSMNHLLQEETSPAVATDSSPPGAFPPRRHTGLIARAKRLHAQRGRRDPPVSNSLGFPEAGRTGRQPRDSHFNSYRPNSPEATKNALSAVFFSAHLQILQYLTAS